MNLYLISQSTNDDWDTYDSAVVCANTPEEAQNIDPASGQPMQWTQPADLQEDQHWWPPDHWAYNPSDVIVLLIGTADPSWTEPAVICASFNAG
jgi:hypothetical protein